MSFDAAAHALIGIDVVVRFHDPAQLFELDRAVFSLVGQRYRPLRIILALQRFTPAQEAAVRAALAPLLRLAGDVELVVENYRDPLPADARGALLNRGIARATGRYFAILDYDDTLKPEAYALLVGRLEASGAAIAFARTPIVDIEENEGFHYVRGKNYVFEGEGLADLFEGNFCPIHSYVMDRARIPAGLLRYEEGLIIEEDYELLLRLCAQVVPDFELLHTVIGFYVFKNNQSTTFSTENARKAEVAARMKLAREFVALRKGMTGLSREVQQLLGVADYDPRLTIAGWLSRRQAEEEASSPVAPDGGGPA